MTRDVKEAVIETDMASDREIVVSVEKVRNKRAGNTVAVRGIIKQKQPRAIYIAGLKV